LNLLYHHQHLSPSAFYIWVQKHIKARYVSLWFILLFLENRKSQKSNFCFYHSPTYESEHTQGKVCIILLHWTCKSLWLQIEQAFFYFNSHTSIVECWMSILSSLHKNASPQCILWSFYSQIVKASLHSSCFPHTNSFQAPTFNF